MRDSLVQIKCDRGRSTSVENYRVPAFFTKYYNKWFVSDEEKFLWEGETINATNVHVFVRLMKKTGSTYQEVGLEAGGDLGASQVYCIKSFSEVMKVENELIDF